MKVNEIIKIYKLANPTPKEREKWKEGSVFLDTINGFNLYKKSVENQEVYFYQNNEDKIVAYAITENKKRSKESYWWLIELWTAPNFRKKGLAGSLIEFIKNEKTYLILDVEMTEDSYQLITKLIKNGNVTAQILDLKSSEAIQYTPGDDIEKDENKTFVLEDYRLRLNGLGLLVCSDYFSILSDKNKPKKIIDKSNRTVNYNFGIPIKESYVIDKDLNL